jgi:general secretion pathway protein A
VSTVSAKTGHVSGVLRIEAGAVRHHAEPAFLFHSGKHREALNHLLYGIRERKGFVQLTGEVGAGKTTLCRALLEQLDGALSTALILNPVLNADELMKAIATEFGLK